MSTNPIPCPFCGGKAAIVSDGPLFMGECSDCGAATRRAPYRSKAEMFWNRRPAPTPSPQGGGDTREAVARHLFDECFKNLGFTTVTWESNPDSREYFFTKADKILSLIHPQQGREEAK